MSKDKAQKGAPQGMPPRPKLNPKVALRILKYMMRYKFKLAFIIVCIVVSAIASVSGTMFIQTLIDDYITPLLSASSPDFSGLLAAILRLIVIYAFGILALFFQARTVASVAQGTLKTIRDEMFSKMQSLPVKYFDTHTYGDLMSRYTNDTDTLEQMIGQSIPNLVSSLVSVVTVFAAMVSTSPAMTLFVLCFVGLMLTFTRKIAGLSGRYFVAQQKSVGRANGYIEEMIHGQKVVKVFCHEEAAKRDFDKINEELCENTTKAHSIANILMPIMNNLGHLQYVLLAILGGGLAIFFADTIAEGGALAFFLGGAGGLTLGGIASFLQLSKGFTNPINQMSQQLNSIVMAMAGAERIFTLMDEEPECDDGYVTLVNVDDDMNECERRTGKWAWKHPHGDGSVTYTPLRGEVRFYDVDFEYEEGKPVLHNITLYAEPGQKVAFVGATGAGKTTITNLINRFYDIADGKIRYDGININKIKKSDLRRSLGVVLQDVNLFTGTVMENIRYGKMDATDEEIYQAARLANADDFIRRLPEGYNTMLTGDGGSLSQGQRQLISIARAAVADPPVMILDEATSSIDTRTEAIVSKGMDALMKGRTVFVIAHRLSTVQNSDVIMVLEHGRIIERGNHDKLISEMGKYYQLYTGAFELE